ncbi:MAG: hypothetical protein ACREMA_08220 [Longimicrobiales bacterium]
MHRDRPETALPALALLALTLGGCTPLPASTDGAGTSVECTSGNDHDGDGLSDECELLLARVFAPELRVSAETCNWDASLSPARPGGEYYFGTQPHGARAVRLIYLPAYYRDCGWTGFKCRLGLTGCSGHSGDSELIAIDLERTSTNRWYTTGIFPSAHCFGRSTGNCRWYRETELAAFEWIDRSRSAAIVWVAAGKNAHYASRAGCDRGHWFYDTCDNNKNSLRYPIASQLQNIGSRMRPVGGDGCVNARNAGWLSRSVDPNTRECLWSEHISFTGWQRPAAGAATPYGRYLRELDVR